MIFCFRHHSHQKPNNHLHSRCTNSLKSSIKPRQPLIHYNNVMFSSTTGRASNDYLAESVDSIPIPRQYQQQRHAPTTSSDLASFTSSNLYYAKVQAL